MLEKPDLPDETIIACLRDVYGLGVAQIAFLPLGADVNTAVYRVLAEDGASYFLKLRGGAFDELVVAIPQFLGGQGMGTIIAPIPTRERDLWARVDRFTMILYPFVEGQNGFDAHVSDRHWIELGVALKRMHTAVVPPSLRQRIPQETFASHWRDRVKTFQARVEDTPFADPVAARLAAFMQTKRDLIHDLVGRAERLARALQTRPLVYVLCHADIHAANILVGSNDGLYIVDWDTLVLAPKERDLMFVGAGLGIGDTAQQQALFYQGYGQTGIDPMALAYYRYERIIQDIAAFCEQLLLTDEGGADREQALGYVVSSFLPNHVVERAYTSDTLAQA
jgi:spectinomycin phosphotransferase